MQVGRSMKRAFGAVVTAGVLAGTVIIGTAGSASASTISNGYVQLCAQGDYAAVVQFPYRGGFESTVVNPGTCWYHYMGGNSWEPINVINQGGRLLRTVWYDGAVSGVGIGAEGSGANEYVWTW